MTTPLAMTLRGYIKHVPERWRPHLAAAADAVEECARLRAERDEALALLREAQRYIYADTVLYDRIDAALAQEGGR